MAEPQRFDTVLRVVIAALVVATLAVGGWFGYTVYRDRLAAEDTVPALRLARTLRTQIKANPNDAVLRVRLGEALGAAGKSQEAIEQFNAALKISPKHTGAFMDLGILAMSNHRDEEAKGYFKKVIELTEGSDMADTNQRRELALHNLGVLSYQQKDYEGAIGYFKAALRIRGDASDTYVYLAQSLEAIGQVQDAESAVSVAIRFDPNFAQARYLLGKYMLANGDRLTASSHIGRARELAPGAPEPKKIADEIGDPAALFKKAQAELTSDPDAALEDSLVAFNLDRKNNIPAAMFAAKLLIKKGDKAGALNVYERAAEVVPANAEVAALVKKYTPKSKTSK